MDKYFRIHGDNIIECSRTLHLISESLGVKPALSAEDSFYKPVYHIDYQIYSITIELLPGYDRWGMSIDHVIESYGGCLREGADSYITSIEKGQEQIILVIEYCSALPAGNNAWQRSGRAYASMMAGVPYLYYAEIGGVELNIFREVIAPRFPNPIVPFSYMVASKRMGGVCIPVYRPHPSIPSNIYKQYQGTFGIDSSKELIKNVILGKDYTQYAKTLRKKSLILVEELSSHRHGHDTLWPEEWIDFYLSDQPLEWLAQSEHFLPWHKNFQKKVAVSEAFTHFKQSVMSLEPGSLGAKNIPICFMPKEKVNDFVNIFKSFYHHDLNISPTEDLVIVWICGYKPRGDDSRPDRGLTSLARMLVGNDTKILAIVYGPAKESSYATLQYPNGLSTNGLWQSIVELADYGLFDSIHYPAPVFYEFNHRRHMNHQPVVFPYQRAQLTKFGEHDVDTVIHQLFTIHSLKNVKECFCNPPGGDWSGISYFDDSAEYRWTSLPRVSVVSGKRPDHIIEIKDRDSGKTIFFSIESKGKGSNLEKSIGKNLYTYVESMFKTPPTSMRKLHESWHSYNEFIQLGLHDVISVGAFMFKNTIEMKSLLIYKKLDAIIAIEFGEEIRLHLTFTDKGAIVGQILEKIRQNIGHFIIEID